MTISDEEVADTLKRLQEILGYFDAEANEALAGQTERGDLWSDIEIPVADLRVILTELQARRAQQAVSVDDMAAVLWKTEATDAGVPQGAVDRRTRSAFEDESDSTKARWRKFAVAAIHAAQEVK